MESLVWGVVWVFVLLRFCGDFLYFKNKFNKGLCAIAVDIRDSVLGQNRSSEILRSLIILLSVCEFHAGSTCYVLDIFFITYFLSITENGLKILN